jgi:hypothetical protein
MIGTTIALLTLAGAGIATQAYGQVKAGQAAKQAGLDQQRVAELEAQQSEYNANIADLQASDAITRGQIEESRYRTQVRGLIGAQRAGFAGQNVDIKTGSAAAVQADSAYLGEIDAQMIRANAKREAFGYSAQADDLRHTAQVQRAGGELDARAGRNAATAGDIAAAGSILTGTSSLLLSKYGWGRAGA